MSSAIRFIARRYLRSRHQFRFISLLTLLAFTGITIGVTALIIVLSIFNGFRELIQHQLLRFDPHLEITFPSSFPPDSLDFYQQRIQHLPGIQSVVPVVSGKALLLSGKRFQMIRLIGIAPDSTTFKILDSTLVTGSAHLPPFPQNRLLIGISLANALSLLPKDSATILAATTFEEFLFTFPAYQQLAFRIQGVFRAQDQRYDALAAFTHFTSALRILPPATRRLHLRIRCTQMEELKSVKAQLQPLLPAGTKLREWKELNRNLYNVMQLERTVAFGVISLIVFVAIFSLTAVLFMLLYVKKPEIAILKTIGASSNHIQQIFLLISLFLGAGTTLSGSLLGSAFVLSQQIWGWIPLDPQRYIVSALPMALHLQDVALVAGVTFILTLIAGSLPARRAAALRSVYGLLYEERIS